MALSIIIPLHNTPKELFTRALYSLLVQTKNQFLTYVIDDASNNGVDYEEIVDSFKDKTNINYFRLDTNVGPGVARNKGLEICHPGTDYVMFLDADDILQPRAVEYLYTESKVNNSDIIVSPILRQGAHRTEDGYVPIKKCATWLHGKIYRKEFLDNQEIRFLDKFMYNEDVYFNVVALNLAKKVLELNEPFYIWCNNKESVTRINGAVEFGHKHNIEYIDASWNAILKILEWDDSKDVGSILANIYNAYQKENEQNQLLIDIRIDLSLSKLNKEQISKIKIGDSFIARAKTGDENGLFKQSAKQWYDFLIGGRC